MRPRWRSRVPAWPVILSLAGALLLVSAAPAPRPTEDGYDLWLRYRRVESPSLRAQYQARATQLVAPGQSGTDSIIRAELLTALDGMLGSPPALADRVDRDGAIEIGTPRTINLTAEPGLVAELRGVGAEGFVIRSAIRRAKRTTVIVGNSDVGALHGAFHFLRLIQTRASIANLTVVSAPRIALRVLDHWDNLDGSIERGYAGRSLWDWDRLPESLPQRYRDYARANASLGINGTVLTNVNANATVLSAPYLRKVAALAGVFRPFGIRVYLTARFSAPIELGHLPTADPLDPAVRAWWKAKIDEVYDSIPDFGGFVVKANSEGQPGPQDYKRSHVDGANMMAQALAPHRGVVMWRAFVYSNEVPADRIRQAYDEFHPLDGAFLDNVLVQVKSGPLDFQPREPFHPLFGGMPRTPLMLELQITKEYLGQDTHLAYLAPYFKEVLDADTHAKGAGSTVARVIDGSLDNHERSGIAGVANIGDDRNWTGSHFNQANWYAFGRLAWDPALSAGGIADEWIRQTLTNDPPAVGVIRSMMLMSREAVVNYMTPLGLAHIMATGHHYGPGAWADGGRADWTPSYYHRADTGGIGFDRTARGSNAVAQYAPVLRDQFGNRNTVPESMLLWFHHVSWNDRLRSGRSVWTELALHYQAGVDSVRAMQRAWQRTAQAVDSARFHEVNSFLAIQEREARWWRDASLAYFGRFSRQPLPPGVEPAAHPFDFYRTLRCPPDRTKPRCELLNAAP